MSFDHVHKVAISNSTPVKHRLFTPALLELLLLTQQNKSLMQSVPTVPPSCEGASTQTNGILRNEPLKTKKIHSILGRAR